MASTRISSNWISTPIVSSEVVSIVHVPFMFVVYGAAQTAGRRLGRLVMELPEKPNNRRYSREKEMDRCNRKWCVDRRYRRGRVELCGRGQFGGP
ncbi:hypothetical protein DESC_940044 [Desulfosarcina cetonica]|nr:hypothetical protein DESC_940044 [Desulfosarcina cetonica]